MVCIKCVSAWIVVIVTMLQKSEGKACNGRGSCPPGQLCGLSAVGGTGAVCMPPAAASDKAALKAFREAQHSSARMQGGCLASWSDGTDPCEWEGIKCCPAGQDFERFTQTRVCALEVPNCGGLVMTDSIGDLEGLAFLNFDKNAADRVPPLERLHSMYQLSMQANSIRELPATVGQLHNLSLLAVSSNLLEFLPESLGNATALTQLHLDNNRLARLPNSLGRLVSLQNLLVANNRLDTVPDSLGNLHQLKILDLSENLIQELPKECSMDSLLEARFQGNRLLGVPDCFVGRMLERLQISRNRIGDLPALSSAKLQLVSAENNSIVELPKTIPKELSHLYLGSNPLLIDPLQFSEWLQNASSLQHLDVSLTSSLQYGPWFTPADGMCTKTFAGHQTNIPTCTPRINVRAPAHWSAVTGMECRIGRLCSFLIQIYDNQQVPLHTTLPDPRGQNAVSMRVRGTEKRQLLHDNRDGTYTATVPDEWLTAVGGSTLDADAGVFDAMVRLELRRGVGTTEVEFFAGMTTTDDRVCGEPPFPNCPLTIRVSPPDCHRQLGPFGRLNPRTNTTCECLEGYYKAGNRCVKQCLHNQQQILVNGTVTCVCMRGTYNTSAVRLRCMYAWPPIATPAEDVCMPCPICAQCDSGTGGAPSVRPGWRENMTTSGGSFDYGSGLSLDIFVCPDQDEPIVSSCPTYVVGDSTPECLSNHSGALCAPCAAGYSANGFGCVPCAQLTEISFGLSWTQVAITVGISCATCIGAIMCLRSFLPKALEANAERGVLKAATEILPAVLQMREVVWCNVRILLGMFQVVSLLQRTLDATFPPVFSILCHWVGLVSADSSSLLTLFQFDCYVAPANAFLYGWLVKVFGVPLLVAWALLALYCADKKRETGFESDLSSEDTIYDGGFRAESDREDPIEQAVNHTSNISTRSPGVAKAKLKDRIFNCVTLLYPWISATIISALQCRELGEEMSVLLHDYRVSCDTTTYSKLYWTACVMTVIVPIGVPMSLYVWMETSIRRNMKMYAESQDRQGVRDGEGHGGSLHIDQERLSARLLWNPWPISVYDIDYQVGRDRESSLAFDFSTYNNQHLKEMWFVLYEYRDGWVRYEPLDIVRKLILTSGLQLAWRGTGLQRLVACITAAVLMCLQLHCKPYREPRSNLLKTATDANILLVIATSMLLHDQSLQPSDLGAVSPAEPYGRTPYGWMLVFTTAAVTAAILLESANRVAHAWRLNEKIKASIDDHEMMMRVGGTFT